MLWVMLCDLLLGADAWCFAERKTGTATNLIGIFDLDPLTQDTTSTTINAEVRSITNGHIAIIESGNQSLTAYCSGPILLC